MRMKPLPKWLTVVRGILSFLTATLLILATFTAVIGTTVHQKALAMETYDQILLETRLSERSHGMVANLIVSTGLEAVSNTYPVYLSDVTIQDWESVAEVVLPITWYEELFSDLLRSVVDWFRGDGLSDPVLEIDLGPVKSALNGPNGSLAILPLMKDIPDCPKAGVVVITKYAPSGLLSCWPAEDSLTRPAAEIAQDTARLLPDQITFQAMIGQGLLPQTALETLHETHEMMAKIDTWNAWLIRLSVLLLVVFCGLNLGSLERLMRSLRYPLYGTASLILLFTAGWYAMSEWGLGPILAGLLAGVEIETQSLILDIFRSLTTILEKTWLIYGFGALAAGVVFHAAAMLIRKIQNHQVKIKQAPAQTYLRIKKPIR